MTLWQYVQENAMRGACQCGRCIDAFENPEDHQPEAAIAILFKIVRLPH